MSNFIRRMNMRHFLAILGVAGSAALAWAGPDVDRSDAAQVKQSEQVRERRSGPDEFKAMLRAYDTDPGSVSEAELNAAAGQRDARWSRLYWHTDLESAKAAARGEHKPILYLRMLGKLTDEYSCANSRFFRTVLYANKDVSDLLRQRFVLVWESERPVPQVTIDYGDGRVLKRTITGNSIHYVLDAEGNVVDALPGLYDPATFTAILRRAGEAAGSGSAQIRRAHLLSESSELTRQWQVESAGLGMGTAGQNPEAVEAAARGVTKQEVEVPLLAMFTPGAREAAPRAEGKMRAELPIVRAVTPAQPVPAAEAGQRAFGKMSVERPLIREVVPDAAAVPADVAAAMAVSKFRIERPLVNSMVPGAAAPPPSDADSPVWQRVAARHLSSTRLDANSRALIRSQNPTAYVATGSLQRVVDQFRRSIAMDTVRNNHLFRRQILEWLQASAGQADLQILNERVYAELFLTPRSDPWLGLVPESTYSALTNDGCTVH